MAAMEPGDGCLQTSRIMRILRRLVKIPGVDARRAEAERLARAMEAYRATYSNEARVRLSNELQEWLLVRLQSHDKLERLGSIEAYASLTRVTKELYSDRIMRAYAAIRTLDQPNVLALADYETSEASVKLLRLLCTEPGACISRVVDNILTSSVLGVQYAHTTSLNDDPGYFARVARNCMIIGELCDLFPSDATQDVNLTITSLCTLLVCHEDAMFRKYTVQCLNKLLAVCSSLPDEDTVEELSRLTYHAMSVHVKTILTPFAMDPGSTPPAGYVAISGALVAINCMLVNPGFKKLLYTADNEGRTSYDKFCQLAFAYRVVADSALQEAIAELLVSLTVFDTHRFIESGSLDTAMDYLFARARSDHSRHAEDAWSSGSAVSPMDREKALGAAGRLATTIGAEKFKPFLSRAQALCHELLVETISAGATKHSLRAGDVLTFVTNVAGAATVEDPGYVQASKYLLGLMFQTGVSQALTEALRAHVRVVPRHKDYIQNMFIRKLEGLLSVSEEPEKGNPVGSKPVPRATDKSARRDLGNTSTRRRGNAAGSSSDGPCRQLIRIDATSSAEDLFQVRTPQNATVGYVSALAEHRWPAPAARSDLYLLDDDSHLELPPRYRDLYSESSSIMTPAAVALLALVKFDFGSLPPARIAWFANQHVVRRLESNRPVFRRLAAKAVSNLMKFAIRGERGKLLSKTAMVVSQLVSVAVADPSRRVRLTVVKQLLSVEFRRYLAQAETLPRLALIMHDEDIEIRKHAVTLVCELTKLGMAVGEPLIREYLTHILALLCWPPQQGHARNVFGHMKTQACTVLRVMLQTADVQLLVRYGDSIFQALLGCLREQMTSDGQVDVGSAVPVLLAIGDLAGELDVSLMSHVGELVPLLVRAVLDVDSSSCDTEFRIAALRALARVVQNTALQMKPYDFDPRLLGHLMSSLKSESNGRARCETLGLLGAMGAVNPDRDDIKYVSLPSSETVSSGRGVYGQGQPMTFGMNPPPLANQSGGIMRITARTPGRVMDNLPILPFNAGVTLENLSNRSQPSIEQTLVGATGPCPPAQNAAMAVDFKWLSEVYGGKIAVWQQAQLSTESLVSRLEHPYTVSPVYFPSVVLDFLHRLIGQAKHAALHIEAVESLVLLVRVLKATKVSAEFLPYIVPRLLWMLQPVQGGHMRSQMTSQIQHLFRHFLDLVHSVGDEFVPYLPDTVALCHAYLCQEDPSAPDSPILYATELLQELRLETGASFRPFCLHVMGSLISAIVRDCSPLRFVARSCLKTIECFGDLLSGYASVVVSVLVFMIEDQDAPVVVREESIATLCALFGKVEHLEDLASSVVHPLIRLVGAVPRGPFENTTPEDKNLEYSRLGTWAARALRIFGLHSPEAFLPFAPVVAKAVVFGVLDRQNIQVKGLEAVLLRSIDVVAFNILGYNEEKPSVSVCDVQEKLEGEFQRYGTASVFEAVCVLGPRSNNTVEAEGVIGSHQQDSAALLRAFQVHEKFSPEEWNQWMDNLCSQLLRQSTSSSMRTVANLGERYPRLVRDLFNAAFLSYWPHQPEEEAALSGQTLELVLVFERAFNSKSIPLNVKQSLLDLVEFMDHGERPIPLKVELLARAAVEVGAFAKALRHREAEYTHDVGLPENCSADVLMPIVADPNTGLIEIYTQLGHNVSAVGIVSHVKFLVGKDAVRRINQQYDESLEMYEQALSVYRDASDRLNPGLDFATVTAGSFERGKQVFLSRLSSDSTGIPADLALALTLRSANPESSMVDNTFLKYQMDELEYSELKADRDVRWYLKLSELRVLNRLGEWREMETKVSDIWSTVAENQDAKSCIAIEGRAASVAFDLSKWDEFEERVDSIGDGSWSKEFYQSLLCVQRSSEDPSMQNQAEDRISAARKLLDTGFTSRAAEGYPRAYDDFLNAQHLVEMEEMVSCLRLGKTCSGLNRLVSLWETRQQDAKPDQHTLYRVLMIRSLLLLPSENKTHWLKFAAKCRKCNRVPMATEALRKMLSHLLDSHSFGSDNSRSAMAKLLVSDEGRAVTPVSAWSVESLQAIPDIAVMYACTKHLWYLKHRCTAIQGLRRFIESHTAMGRKTLQSRELGPSKDNVNEEDVRLFSEMYLKLAKWTDFMVTEDCENDAFSMNQTCAYALKATQWNPSGYKAWHFWASLNARLAQEVVESLEAAKSVNRGALNSSASPRSKNESVIQLGGKLPPIDSLAAGYIKQAVHGYFKAIRVGNESGLEDILTLLALWFRYGGYAELDEVFKEGLKESAPECWLPVVPQIIARLQSQHGLVRLGIEMLLKKIGMAHPQVAVYPLVVAATTPGASSTQVGRRKSALRILKYLEERHTDIVVQARTVARELNRVAILDIERWVEGIEEASRLFYTEGNPRAMVEKLGALYNMTVGKGGETTCEVDFQKLFAEDLRRAHMLGMEYVRIDNLLVNMRLGNDAGTDESDLLAQQRQVIDRTWDVYCQVFKKMQKLHASLTHVDLNRCSPNLYSAEDMVLVIPGTYSPGMDNPVHIKSFSKRLEIIQSKQHPRKLRILGSDGKWYNFLLKGNDDLRQDERVMQVFRLMNLHLSQSEDRDVRGVAKLQLYSIIVLSTTAGLIQWVTESDTMHALVKGFREKRKQIPNIEQKVMLRMACDLDRLPLLQKIDVFQKMLADTGGQDISRILWLRSRNSEMWLDRRTNFARTLATTSMSGYILGLGDRHPSNIMIGKNTGKIMHIDFGDCFEVAMRRDKFPERIPFRLTRMFVQALEPCGVRGHFRHIAVAFMRVLRLENVKQALLSMMEAFVFDPLIRQKLLDGDELLRVTLPEEFVGSRYVPQSHLANQFARAGSLAGALGLAERAEDANDRLIPAGPTPSQRSRSIRARTIGVNGESMSKRFAALAIDRASEAITRVHEKLTGLDFDDVDPEHPLSVEEQVDRLVEEAQNVEHLCQLFSGWVASW